MILVRILGYLSAIIAISAFGYDVARSVSEGVLTATPLGKAWYHVAPATLNAAQAGIQRHIWPPLWSDGVVHLLLVPGWISFGVLAYVLLYLAGPVTERRR